jgi:hypothetical protein
MTEMSDSTEVIRTTQRPTGLERAPTIAGLSILPGGATDSAAAAR